MKSNKIIFSILPLCLLLISFEAFAINLLPYPTKEKQEMNKSVTPKAVVLAWVKAFNRGDAKKISEFYADDAINHQVTQKPVRGKQAIYEMFKKEFATAKMKCIIENVFEDKNWVILEWKDPVGLRGCGFFHIVNEKIVFQRGYWDKLTFLRLHHLPIPKK